MSSILKTILNVFLLISIWSFSEDHMIITSPVPLNNNGDMVQTSCFGSRLDPMNRKKNQWHHGADIRAAKGAPLYAPTSGTITAIGGDRILANGGLQIGISDKLGNRHIFLHLEDNYLTSNYRDKPLKEGDYVLAGTVIALTGNTGKRTTGPHLHWQITNKHGQWVNPLKFMNPDNTILATNCKNGPELMPVKCYKEDRLPSKLNKAKSCERGYEALSIGTDSDWKEQWLREYRKLNRKLLQ